MYTASFPLSPYPLQVLTPLSLRAFVHTSASTTNPHTFSPLTPVSPPSSLSHSCLKTPPPNQSSRSRSAMTLSKTLTFLVTHRSTSKLYSVTTNIGLDNKSTSFYTLPWTSVKSRPGSPAQGMSQTADTLHTMLVQLLPTPH